MCWNDLKFFLCSKVKAANIQELINGINLFWSQVVSKNYCNKKIDHLNKALTKCIALEGKATGF